MTTTGVFNGSDSKNNYQLTVTATGNTTASLDERVTPIGSGGYSEKSYEVTGVEVLSGVLKGKIGWSDLTVELVAPSSVHIVVDTHLPFGFGGIDETIQISPEQFANAQDLFKTGGFPTS